MQNRTPASAGDLSVPSPSDIRRVVGQVSDETIMEILTSGASLLEIENAALQIQGDDGVRRTHGLTGASARVYDILSDDEVFAVGPD